MGITIAGTLVFFMTVYIIFTRRSMRKILISLFTLNLLYEGFINVGYILTVGGQTFKVQDFLQLVMGVVSILIISGRKKVPLQLLLFFLALSASVISLLFRPYGEMVKTFNGVDFVNNLKYMHYPSFDMQTAKTSLRLLCFAINGTMIAKVIREDEWHRIRNSYFLAGRLIIGYAWVEFILKNVLHVTITETLIYYLFGSDTSIMTALHRNGLGVIIGLNNEPSQFAMMLYSYLIIYLIAKEWERQTKKQICLTISAFVLMIVCGSFRPVSMIPVLIIIYLTMSGKPWHYIAIAVVVAVALGILQALGMTEYYLGRLTRAFSFLRTFDTSIAGGEAGRLNTIVEAFRVFLKRPFLGIGPGQTFAYGFIPSILVMMGTFGLVTWYGMIFGGISRLSFNMRSGKMIWIVFLLSCSWIYTDSIAIGYSIYILGIALELKFYNRN